MIISHEHKFIFLKTNKTASTSAEIALSKFCGPGDVITPIAPEDEEIRRRLGHPGPRNCHAPLLDYRFTDVRKWLATGERKRRYYPHIPARELKAFIGPSIWNSYFKFCIERNPWDRFVSIYYWRNQSEPRPSIDEFLESGIPLMLKVRGFEVYTIDGRVAVDKVCLFERLEADLAQVCERIGIDEKLVLPRAKSSSRKDGRHYREILNERQAEKIRQLCKEEIELFAYEF